MNNNSNIFYHLLRDSLRRYSQNVHFTGKTNPIEVNLNGIMYSIHISDIHFANRDNPDEYRIQITPQELEIHRLKQEQGYRAVFLGAFMSGKVFVGWEPHYVLSIQAKQRFSVYCRNSQEQIALERNSSVYESTSNTLGRRIKAIALPVEALGAYLENIETFHNLPGEAEISNVIDLGQNAIGGDLMLGTNTIDTHYGTHRERFTFTRTAYPRDPRFKKHVLTAYDNKCCICNRQLAIVQAAHIIPHSEPNSPPEVNNGLALCIEHHRLYDDALLLPGPNRRLVFNHERAEYLVQTNQGAGLNEIAVQHDRVYEVPSNAAYWPSDTYLRKGLEIRLGE